MDSAFSRVPTEEPQEVQGDVSAESPEKFHPKSSPGLSRQLLGGNQRVGVPRFTGVVWTLILSLGALMLLAALTRHSHLLDDFPTNFALLVDALGYGGTDSTPQLFVLEAARKSGGTGSPIWSPLCAPPWLASSPFAGCAFHFEKYVPSAWEQLWTNSVKPRAWQYRVCEIMTKAEHSSKAVHFLHLVAVAASLAGHVTVHELGLHTTNFSYFDEAALLSEMHYSWSCSSESLDRNASLHAVQLIEPLVGGLRDPFTFCKTMEEFHFGDRRPETAQWPIDDIDLHGGPVQSKRFLITAGRAPFKLELTSGASSLEVQAAKCQLEWISGLRMPLFNLDRAAALPTVDSFSSYIPDTDSPRRILFDIGASYYSSWGEETGAVGASWFVKQLETLHASFDRIICFEYQQLPNDRVWSQIPMEVISRYTFINQGCSADQNSTMNPWNLLVQIARPSDFVVIKLDIDNPRIEEGLIRQLLSNTSISSRIDEMAYEHHVWFPEMTTAWQLGPENSDHLSTSYWLFPAIRRLGIRMHSWP